MIVFIPVRNTRTKSVPLRSDAVVERLRGLHPRVIDLSLDRVQRLLDALGNPENSLPCVVHVAGTNGKGSLIAFLKAICEAAGHTVHTYTSPHLVRFVERISVAGSLLDDDALVAVLEECEAANNGQPITFFEVTTAAAFLAFSRTKADVTLVETGLGGRFDATNVFDRPALCAITPVSMDHMSFLGDTLEAIAFEKAGILKKGIEAVIAPQDPRALTVIRSRAETLGTPLSCFGGDWSCEPGTQGFDLRDGAEKITLPQPVLNGPHQIENAALAAVCARRLGLAIDDTAIATGLKQAIWPGRLEKLVAGPLPDLLGPGWELWLDGGHNVAAAQVLAGVLQEWHDKPLYLVFGALSSRDPADFLSVLAPYARHLKAIAIDGEETSLSAADSLQAARSVGFEAAESRSLAEALSAIRAESATPGRVLICGSLYLAGAVLAENKTPPGDGVLQTGLV
jgi:dihydrofolate synthase/folylpolyglutamate synthase